MMKKLLLILLCLPMIGFGQDNFNEANRYFQLGVSAINQGKYGTSIDHFTASIKLHPDANAYYNRALAHHKLKNWYAAVLDYTEAIKLMPDNSSYYLSRGISKFWLNDVDPCPDYKKACDLGGNCSQFQKFCTN